MTTIKTNLILLLAFVFSGFLNAQAIDSEKWDCDSAQKSKIESRVMFAIEEREVKQLVKPNNTCEIGKFSVDIGVNRKGEVIQADLNTKVSPIISNKLKTFLIDAALKSKFIEKNRAPAKQKGNITYEFRLKDN